MTGRVAAHNDPAWRDRADFLIHAVLEDDSQSPTAVQSEQLWARQLTEFTFEICCIPFYVYGVALGDVVETGPEYRLLRVIQSSGRAVFRALVQESEAGPDAVVNRLRVAGGIIESYTHRLFSIDARDSEHAERIGALLDVMQDEGLLVCEAGRLQ